MQLRTYVQEQDLTAAKFAGLVDYPVATVRKWIQRDRIPRPEAMRKIEQITGGQVTASDFIGERPAPDHHEARA